MNELKPNVVYSPQNGMWCTGCSCNRAAQQCVSPDPDTIIIPVVFGQKQIGDTIYYFRANMLNVVKTKAAADIAVNNGYARRPNQQQLRTMQLVRAW